MTTPDQAAGLPAPDTAASAAPRPKQPSETVLLANRISEIARAVDGVHRVGTPAGRVLASVRTTASGRQFAPGVRIDQLTGGVQVSVVAEYPVNVLEVAERVRSQVAAAVPGVDGSRIDVLVTDVHGPFDREELDSDPLAGAREQAADTVERARAGAADIAADAREQAAETAEQAKAGAEQVADAAQAGAAEVADRAKAVAEAAKPAPEPAPEPAVEQPAPAPTVVIVVEPAAEPDAPEAPEARP